MVNNQQFPSDNDRHLTDAFRALGAQDSVQPDELMRRRQLAAMTSSQRKSHRSRLLGAVAAAVVLIAGVAIATQSKNSHSTTTSGDAGAVAELQPLKEVKDLTAIPFTRTEDYVILDVEASRASEITQELTALIGSNPAIAGKNSRTTTFVVPASVARAIKNTSGVTATADTRMKATTEQINPPSWGLDRIDATDVPLNNSYTYYSTGASSYVYVIDTGIYSGSSDLSGRVVSGYTAVADGNGTEDCNGHGTHVAGTIAGTTYGVAKQSKVVAVRVLDCTGSGYTSSVVAGINWVIASHPGGAGVINLSLGGAANSAVDTAVANATAAGLTVVVAAGNSSADACNYSPARAPSALTIGAINKGDTQASYSNTGSCVDMWAPGTAITSDWIGGPNATNTISGTSMASPHVAGLAARLAQAFPGISGSEITTKLTANKLSTLSVTSFAEAPPVETTTTTLAPETTTLPPDTTTTVPGVTTTLPGATTTLPVVTTTVPRTTTTAPRSTTTVPRTTPPTTKPKKKVASPKQFNLAYRVTNGTSTLIASWFDDKTPDMYKIECSTNRGRDMESDDADSYDAESGIFISRADVRTRDDGRSETALLITPPQKSLCWITAFDDTAKSPRSNVSPMPKPILITPITTTTTIAPTTTVPDTTLAPANKSNSGSTVKPVTTTPAPKPVATTAAPKPVPTTKAPAKKKTAQDD